MIEKKERKIQNIFKLGWHKVVEEEKAGKIEIRDVVKKEVEKLLRCGDIEHGHALYVCPCCGEEKRVAFTCKSRLCTSCGKVKTDEWQEDIEGLIGYTKHRHVVFTIPEEFRYLFLKNRKLLKGMVDGTAEVIKYYFKREKKEVPGMIAVIHTFGRSMIWNPHVHMLISEGYVKIEKGTEYWVEHKFFPFEYLRKSWQKVLMDVIKKEYKNNGKIREMINECYKKYEKGLYVYAKDAEYCGYGKIARYIGRYVSRPAIAESRIIKYDEKEVTYCYERHEDGERVEVTEKIEEFIKKVIRHIPDRQFKMIRYYGAYSRRKSRKTKDIKERSCYGYKKEKSMIRWKERIIKAFGFNPLMCPKCKVEMEIVDIVYKRKISLLEVIREKMEKKYERKQEGEIKCA